MFRVTTLAAAYFVCAVTVTMLGCMVKPSRESIEYSNVEGIKVWASDDDDPKDTAIAVLYPRLDPEWTETAKLLLMEGPYCDVKHPFNRVPDTIAGVLLASRDDTNVVWANVDNVPAKDLIVRTMLGATSYRSIYILTRIGPYSWSMISEESRYQPYYGDVDGDDRVELYLSTPEMVVVDDRVIPTRYRVLKWVAGKGLVEAGIIAAEDLPVDKIKEF